MPINGPASYLPTTDEFLSHWALANTALGAAGPVTVLNGVTAAGLLAFRTQLAVTRTAVENVRNLREGARFDVDAAKAALLARLNQFNQKIRSLAPESRWETMLPKAYTVSEGQGKVLMALDDLLSVWQQYEGAETDLSLLGGYNLPVFTTQLNALKTGFTALSDADKKLAGKRGERTEIENKIYPILKAYRQAIPAQFAEGTSILTTLPRLSPIPGVKVDPVQANGNFNATTLNADLNWTASTEPDLANYEVRGVAGPDYDTDDETVLVTLPPGSPRTYSTDFALATPGNIATYKVYVILNSGNERGSNAVAVPRPV